MEFTGVREGEPHKNYPRCMFRELGSSCHIPTKKSLKKGDITFIAHYGETVSDNDVRAYKFDEDKALTAIEKQYREWSAWE